MQGLCRDSAGIQRMFHLFYMSRSVRSDGLVRREPSLGVLTRLQDGSMLDIMNTMPPFRGQKRCARENTSYSARRSGMDHAMRRPSSTIGKRTPGRMRASFAGALAVFWLGLLPAATEVPGGEAQEPKSRVPPGIAARLSPATRARLNLKAGAARGTTRPAQAAAKAEVGPGQRHPTTRRTGRPWWSAEERRREAARSSRRSMARPSS